MGTSGMPDPLFPQEAGVRTRVEGMMTDSTRNIDVSAIDMDCNGNVTFREPAWVSNFTVEPGLPGIGKKGRWRVRFPQGGNFEPPTQNIGARISGGGLGKNKSGLDFNEYQLPTGEFLYPELLVPGNPPPRNNFRDFQYLVNGSGPLPLIGSVFESTQLQLGLAPSNFYPNQNSIQLNPFPDDTLPPLTCTPGTFTSVARPVFTFSAESAVRGCNSHFGWHSQHSANRSFCLVADYQSWRSGCNDPERQPSESQLRCSRCGSTAEPGVPAHRGRRRIYSGVSSCNRAGADRYSCAKYCSNRDCFSFRQPGCQRSAGHFDCQRG